MLLQGLVQDGGQNCDSVFTTLPVPNDDLTVPKVDVFDAKAKAFGQSQSSSIEQAGHQPPGAVDSAILPGLHLG